MGVYIILDVTAIPRLFLNTMILCRSSEGGGPQVSLTGLLRYLAGVGLAKVGEHTLGSRRVVCIGRRGECIFLFRFPCVSISLTTDSNWVDQTDLDRISAKFPEEAPADALKRHRDGLGQGDEAA